jgi:hypothetical protein
MNGTGESALVGGGNVSAGGVGIGPGGVGIGIAGGAEPGGAVPSSGTLAGVLGGSGAQGGAFPLPSGMTRQHTFGAGGGGSMNQLLWGGLGNNPLLRQDSYARLDAGGFQRVGMAGGRQDSFQLGHGLLRADSPGFLAGGHAGSQGMLTAQNYRQGPGWGAGNVSDVTSMANLASHMMSAQHQSQQIAQHPQTSQVPRP